MSPVVQQLFIRGEIPPGPYVGVIGTRRPTSYGKAALGALVQPLAGAGITIVSGMAIGTDGLAHEHTLKSGGRTVAVLPSSVDNPYPKRHHQLAQRIEQSGALLSEYPEGEQVQKSHFIARNRIIAALSDVLIVVEAAEKSGTMHTVDFALQMGKEVGAVPGPIQHLYSAGTNRLLKDGAHVITSSEDIFHLLGIEPTDKPLKALTGLPGTIQATLAQEARSISQLVQLTKRNDHDIRQALTELELQNLIARRGDGMYALR